MPDNLKDILVVDDEKDIRDLLKDCLEENHFNVFLAVDGIKALELIEERTPGLVIVDLLLPGEHGINLIKVVKEKYRIPVIIISGVYRQEEVSGFMEEYSVEGFFEKPLDLNKMLEKIYQAVNAGTV